MFIYGLLFLLSYELIASNSIDLLLSNIPISGFLKQAAVEIFKDSTYAFMFTVLVGAIFEGVIFRWVILEQLSKSYGFIKSIAVTSLLFGIIHFNFQQGINAFFIGILFGIIYLKTGSLLITILMHIINNLYAFACTYSPNLQINLLGKFNIIQLVIGIVLLCILFKFFINDKKLFDNNNI